VFIYKTILRINKLPLQMVNEKGMWATEELLTSWKLVKETSWRTKTEQWTRNVGSGRLTETRVWAETWMTPFQISANRMTYTAKTSVALQVTCLEQVYTYIVLTL